MRPARHQALAIDAYPRIAYFCADMDDRLPLQVGESLRFLNPLPDEASRRSGKNLNEASEEKHQFKQENKYLEITLEASRKYASETEVKNYLQIF